ncbi:hypothetical protein GCM10020370_22470 [Paenibacillus hodogayensis]
MNHIGIALGGGKAFRIALPVVLIILTLALIGARTLANHK